MKNIDLTVLRVFKTLAFLLQLRPRSYIPALLLLTFSLFNTTFADSATWKTSPATGDWNHAANWTPLTVPNGPSDTATFATSNITGLSLSANTEVNGILFNPGASAFTITPSPSVTLTISGTGITNNSGITQNFDVPGDGTAVPAIQFTNSATAGSLTMFTNNGSAVRQTRGGIIWFFIRSTAGNGTFINNGGTVSEGGGGLTVFDGESTAANGTVINNGGTVRGAFGGAVWFVGDQPGGAGDSYLIANGGFGRRTGGSIMFLGNSAGDRARVAVFGNGSMDISSHINENFPDVTVEVGSLEGDGNIFLGANNLGVGRNNLSTTFSGVIHDGGPGGCCGGVLTKVGTSTLILTHANTYTGGTTINGGKLVVNNEHDSGTGTGPVQVNSGRLAGTGTIAGDVTIGDGSGRGAALSPGKSAVNRATLTIQSTLVFNSDASYHVGLNTRTAKADQVVAVGVTVNSGAQFFFADLGSGTLTPGTVFTVINNTAATPIAGTFSNLADGSTFTNNGNSYQVNYEGADGNDLTLTVVP